MTIALGPMQLLATEPNDVIEDYVNGLQPDGGEWTNWTRLSQHDHSGGLMGNAVAVTIPPGSITSDQLDPSVLLPYSLTDGSRPFTGPVTMQADAIVRDAILFGQQGSAAAPDTFLTRTAASTLQASSATGMRLDLNAGAAANGANITWSNRASLRWNLTSLGDDSSSPLLLYDHGLAGATFSERLRYTHDGTLTLNAEPTVPTLQVNTLSTGQNPALRLARAAAASQSQWLSFAGGITYGDYQIGRRANDDSLYFSAWNGASLVDRLKLQTDGTMVLNSGAAGSGAILFNAAGIPEQRYMLSTAYQSDLTVQDVIRNGPVVLRISRATNTLTLNPNGGSPALDLQANPATITAPSTFLLRSSGANIQVGPAGTIFGPEGDGTTHLGYSSIRWGQIWSTVPSIATSSAEAKTDITPLDPAEAMAAVRATDAVRFTYRQKPLPPPHRRPTDPYDWKAVRAQQIARPRVAAALTQAGFTTEQAAPLFVIGPQQSSPANTAGVLLAAMKDLDTRLTALEGS